jgi:hypothetical protein
MLLLYRFVQHAAHETREGYEGKAVTALLALSLTTGAAVIEAAPVVYARTLCQP